MYRRASEQNCLSLLDLCNSFLKLTQIHSKLLKLGFQNNPLILTKFTSISSNLDSLHYACSFTFSPESDPTNYDAFLFNTVIKAYAETKHFKHSAVCYYKDMVSYGVMPNNYTYPFVFKACAGIGDLELGKMVHGFVVKLGFGEDGHVLNSMIHMYGSCKDGIEFGEKVFDGMSQWSSVSWSALIGGYVRWGKSNEAVRVFRRMQIAGVRPDEVTMVMVLSACADLGALELGRWVESYIDREKIEMNVPLCNALIDMFAKCGDVDKALSSFRNMPRECNKTIVSWTSVINGMAMHGRGLEAVSLFEEMRRTGLVPDDVAFIGLLTACSHSGLVEEGKQYFHSMMNDYGITPRIEHYGCMVDLLCRAGLVKEAMAFISQMPVSPNPVIWRILIAACALGELNVGERITTNLIENDPLQQSNYVLLSSIYAKKSEWEKKRTVREGMGKNGIKKIPGSSMIELDDGIYEFVAGDKSHRESPKIYAMVDEMERKMRRAGYSATTSDVLLDIDEEDKEGALNRHSEKLAIAFALLKTPRGSPIRIVKNLRVCGDCHSATKLISLIYHREIVVRDRSRFHHFKDGLCSCKDFW